MKLINPSMVPLLWNSASLSTFEKLHFLSSAKRSARLLSMTGLARSDKKVPDKDEPNIKSDGVSKPADPDGYNVNDLDSKEQKVRLDQFKKYMERNAYYEKYKPRIVAAQKTSPRAFLAKVENVMPVKKTDRQTPERLRACDAARKPLGEIMKIDMLMELPKDDVIFIWQEYHKSIKSIGAAMSGAIYDNAESLGKKCGTFILPLPKNDGYEFYLLQYGGESFHFTQLVKYHAYKENSPVCLTLNFYKDLKAVKDVVLVRGEVDKEALSLEEAQHLVVQFNYYYAESNPTRLNLLHKFNAQPGEFDHATVIEELKQLTDDYHDKFPALVKAVGRSTN